MRKLKQNIISLCNNSGIPLEAVYFVVKDTLRDVEDALISMDKQQAAQQQLAEINNSQEEQKNDELYSE